MNFIPYDFSIFFYVFHLLIVEWLLNLNIDIYIYFRTRTDITYEIFIGKTIKCILDTYIIGFFIISLKQIEENTLSLI